MIAAGGFFGFEFYVQQRIASEVEAAFEQIRASGRQGEPRQGFVRPVEPHHHDRGHRGSNRPRSRRSASRSPASRRRVSASRMRRRFAADSIEVSGCRDRRRHRRSAAGGQRLLQGAADRREGLCRPGRPAAPPASASIADVYRFALEQFASRHGGSVTAPDHCRDHATISALRRRRWRLRLYGPRDARHQGRQDRQPRKVDRRRFHGQHRASAGKAGEAHRRNLSISPADFDASSRSPRCSIRRRRTTTNITASTGRSRPPAPTRSRPAQGLQMRIDGMTIDDIGVRPSRLQFPALLAMMPPAGAAADAGAGARAAREGRQVYEGIRIGNAEMRGLSIETPEGPFKLAGDAVQSGERQDRRIRARRRSMAVRRRGREGRALRAQVARCREPDADVGAVREPGATAVARPGCSGCSCCSKAPRLKGLVAPYKNTGKPVNIDTLNLDWGQFVGPIPSKARLAAKMAGPLDPNDPGQQVLVAAGLDKASIDFDLGAAWTEGSRAFALEPVTLEIGSVAKASARVVARQCAARGIFAKRRCRRSSRRRRSRPARSNSRCATLGGIDLAVAQYARTQNISRDAARQRHHRQHQAGSAATAASANPDAMAAVAGARALSSRRPGRR